MGKPVLECSSAADHVRTLRPPQAQLWEEGDLLWRVSRVLDFATQVVQSLASDEWPTGEDNSNSPFAGLQKKVLSETAMLLACAASVQHIQEELHEQVDHLAALVASLARSEPILAAVCADPGLAAGSVVAHAVVSRLGYPDLLLDRLLVDNRVVDSRFGPDKLPLDRLEQEWLARVWGGCTSARPERGLLRRSMLGRPLDVLGACRFDVYSFTHAIIYATDFGARRTTLPRPRIAIAADADAALGLSLDIDDLDVTAELTMTWPMLALPWSPTAIFAFGILATADDQFGFLPGPTFETNQFASASGDERSRHVFATCYHTNYVMGMLCAAALRKGCRPPRRVPAGRSTGSACALLRLLDAGTPSARWRTALRELSPGQQDALAPLILTMLLRRAKDSGDLKTLSTALELALDHKLVEGPSVQQAIAFLRRSAALSRILQEKSRLAEARSGQ